MATAAVRQAKTRTVTQPASTAPSRFVTKCPEADLSPAEKAKHAAAMSDRQLCEHIGRAFGPIRFILRDNLPYIMEARTRFSQQGRQIPVPGKPTFTEWIRETLGFSERHVRRLLQEAKEGETPREVVRTPHIETAAAAMAIASAGFRLAHAVLHKDTQRATSLAKEITATTRNGVLPKDDCEPAIKTLKRGNHGALFRLFQQRLGAVADDVLMPANRNEREDILRQFFESIAGNYFERALVDVVGLSPTREPHTVVYPGSKGRMAETIVSLLPKTGRTYVEPFAGRGSVFWLAATHLDYQRWWLNDIRTAPFFRAVLSMGGTLQVPPRTKAEYYLQWDGFKGGDATAILLEPYLTFSGGGYGTGGFGGKRTASQSSYQRIVRECNRIMKVMSPKITSLDWPETLTGLSKDDIVYLDPPYLNSSVRAYKADDVDHQELVRVLLKARFRWVLSGYAHPVYSGLGKPCHREEVQLRTANCDRVREKRQECLWKNF